MKSSAQPATEMQDFMLRTSLALAVPLHMHELRGQSPATLAGIASAAADVVGSHGDDLQYGGRHCARTFNSLARGLAAAALTAQGGVTWRGMHWCQTPGCRTPDDIAGHMAACPSPPTTIHHQEAP
ncbi:hypothetical protein [Wenjunlia vitaminophila]|uniref:hypothetical protein n=1 Tax=Wenjunlia vitaminophila TaxID=76728 RepID=UPI00039A99C8|nr:hypothetical protein [Wenjunlia vitaminophila]